MAPQRLDDNLFGFVKGAYYQPVGHGSGSDDRNLQADGRGVGLAVGFAVAVWSAARGSHAQKAVHIYQREDLIAQEQDLGVADGLDALLYLLIGITVSMAF